MNKKLTKKKIESIKSLDIINSKLEKILKYSKMDLSHVQIFNETGKSGAQIGKIIHRNKTMIIKIAPKANKLQVEIKGNCYYLDNFLNEIFILYVLNNLKEFLSPTEYQKFNKKRLGRLILKNYRIGQTNQNIFSINEKIGFKLDNQYYSNLKDLFNNNYLEVLRNGEPRIKKQFLTWLVNKLSQFFDLLHFLAINLSFIHSDLKLNNIFIRKNHYARNKNFISNVDFLLADVDKSNLKINVTRVLPKTDKLYQSKFLLKTRMKYMYQFRYECSNDLALNNNMDFYYYDRLCILYDIYLYLYKNIKSKTELYQDLEPLNNFVKKSLGLNDTEFKEFIKPLHNFIVRKFKTNFTFHINHLINEFLKNSK